MLFTSHPLYGHQAQYPNTSLVINWTYLCLWSWLVRWSFCLPAFRLHNYIMAVSFICKRYLFDQEEAHWCSCGYRVHRLQSSSFYLQRKLWMQVFFLTLLIHSKDMWTFVQTFYHKNVFQTWNQHYFSKKEGINMHYLTVPTVNVAVLVLN